MEPPFGVVFLWEEKHEGMLSALWFTWTRVRDSRGKPPMMSNRKAVWVSDSAELLILKRDVRRGLERMARPERSGGTPKAQSESEGASA